MARLLVILQDSDTRALLIRQLSDAGHVVRSVRLVREALEELATDVPDVVLVGLDPRDEVDVGLLRSLRDVCSAPVVVACARRDEAGATKLLRSGADAVLPSPCAPPLLLARITSVLRRSTRREDPAAIVVGGLRLEPRRHVVVVDGRRLHLTPREFDLLAYLARRPREVISRRTILAEVWNCAYVDPQTVHVHLSCLRRKLGETASRPRYLYTVRGVGVRLEPPDDGCIAAGAT